MPSPFPGMDPFIEIVLWRDFLFHATCELSWQLNRSLPRPYVSRINTRDIFLPAPADDSSTRPVVGLKTPACPIEVDLNARPAEPIGERVAMPWIEVWALPSRRPVSVIELLSPETKDCGSDASASYQDHRTTVLKSDASLVEIDIVRGGVSPYYGPRRLGDYRVIVSKPWRRPKADVWPIEFLQPLPTIPVPLRENVEPAPLDLRAALTTVYDRARYDLQLDYASEPDPPLPPAVRAWLTERLKEANA